MRTRLLLIAPICALAMALPAAAADPPTVRLHAAGSLRAALTKVLQLFEHETGVRVVPVYGASGLLRERLAAGEAATCSPRPTWSTRSRSPRPAWSARCAASRATSCAR